jgi:hypothetical protein
LRGLTTYPSVSLIALRVFSRCLITLPQSIALTYTRVCHQSFHSCFRFILGNPGRWRQNAKLATKSEAGERRCGLPFGERAVQMLQTSTRL